MRGMVSLEIAILLSIILIIAVAVGWYIYTTFIASVGGQPRLNIISAEVDTQGNFKIMVVNPGPVDVSVHTVEIAGKTYTYQPPVVVKIGQQDTLSNNIPGLTLTPGTMVPGRVILSGGQSFPFNAVVRPT